METGKETNRKLEANQEETLTTNDAVQSFLNAHNVPTLLFNFFEHVQQLNIELLYDDRKWLNDICFGEALSQLKTLFGEYINVWVNTMENEILDHKKQNAGRFAANCFLREAL